jgi:hypothetical protein
MDQINIFKILLERATLIVNSYGYSESILNDDDYLHDFLIDCKSLFTTDEFDILIAYNSIFQYRIANQVA